MAWCLGTGKTFKMDVFWNVKIGLTCISIRTKLIKILCFYCGDQVDAIFL
jgi:hypothetical protein